MPATWGGVLQSNQFISTQGFLESSNEESVNQLQGINGSVSSYDVIPRCDSQSINSNSNRHYINNGLFKQNDRSIRFPISSKQSYSQSGFLVKRDFTSKIYSRKRKHDSRFFITKKVTLPKNQKLLFYCFLRRRSSWTSCGLFVTSVTRRCKVSDL